MALARSTTIVLVTLAGFAVIFCMIFYAAGGPMGRWGQFYIWKLFSRKAHGGQHFQADGINIYFETFGGGPPVLVLHGGLGSMMGMSYQIMALSMSHLVIAVDSRGHGRSTDDDVPLSYSLMSDDMVKVLDHLHIDQADVVGWSDGGIIGLDLAIRHPEHVRRLVAISANYDADGLDGGISLLGKIPRTPLSYRFRSPDPAHWPILYRKVTTMWQTQPHYTLSDLSHIKAPTLVIAGERDTIKPQHTHQLAKAIPCSHEFIIAGTTHLVPIEKPEIINLKILTFLNRSLP